MTTAIQTAVNDPGTTGSPKYHRVEYTGGDTSGNWTINFTDPGNTEGQVFVLVEPATPFSKIVGEIRLYNGGSKDVKFAGWQIEPDRRPLAQPYPAFGPIPAEPDLPWKAVAWAAFGVVWQSAIFPMGCSAMSGTSRLHSGATISATSSR